MFERMNTNREGLQCNKVCCYVQQNSDIENAVRNLLSCITRHSSPQPVGNIDSASSAGVSQPMGTQVVASGFHEVSQPIRTSTVQNEMQRSFPAIYNNRTRVKRKAPEPPRVIKFLELQFCLQEENTNRSPKDEMLLLQAGLGRRSINISDDADHTEITRLLLEEYPKLKTLRGGWLLQKAAGGSGQRKTTPLPQSSQGYTAKILRTSSNNGKNIIYIVPLQEKIDMTPLPYDAPEFNMPKNVCMTCGTSVPLQLLQFHIEACQQDDTSDDSGSVPKEVSSPEPDICMDSCPIRGKEFSADIMPYHASSCGENFPQMVSSTMNRNFTEESTSVPVVSESTITESSTAGSSSSFTSEYWKRTEIPQRAAVLYRIDLVHEKEAEPSLKFRMDIREDMEDQEGRIISFYKEMEPTLCFLKAKLITSSHPPLRFLCRVTCF
ncbi:uncharacterized protein LOC143481758 isoform X2 [Brachyhypopomus gauderio]|uniref:uncharacterized protein LOC143481758 isoform X2 n=1 Tax=Brachyhypopomus gauderio TaxID=698409 RepID=UPI0040414D33